MNIYVGNLAFNVNREELQALFEQFGTVSSTNIITDKYTGKSRGFGFVEMAQGDEAQTAMTKLDGFEFKGRNLTVNAARPMSDKPQRSNRKRW